MKACRLIAFALVLYAFWLGPAECSGRMARDSDPLAPGQRVRRADRDEANPVERQRIDERMGLIHQLSELEPGAQLAPVGSAAAELETRVRSLTKTGTDRVLIILVEFAGTNSFMWTNGVSTWDPLGICEQSEYDGHNSGNAAASAFFAAKYGITGPTNFIYSGPLHNRIPRPVSQGDISGDLIWTEDFSPNYFEEVTFGNGWNFSYARQDGSMVSADFTGRSAGHYFRDMSGNRYDIAGEVLGWVRVTNSVWYYGADPLPGRRSGASTIAHHGAIPGAGNAGKLVSDALEAAKLAYPGFNWAQYDADGDGNIDRLWIIHAGYGEEENTILLNRTDYSEGGMWSHSSSLSTRYQVVPGVYASKYIMMPENSGISVLSHEFAHNIGARDLYTYGDGETSAGIWTLMADDWTGYPLGFQPQALDPLHLDEWGWLEPLVISSGSPTCEVWIGQASGFPGGANTYRGVKVELPDQEVSMPVVPIGTRQWWGGDESDAAGYMVFNNAVWVPSTGADLIYKAAYDTEKDRDFFEVWIYCDNAWYRRAALSGRSAGFPAYCPFTNSLASFANKYVWVAFQYTTDSITNGAGAFVDDVRIVSGTSTLFADGAEADPTPWNCYAPWLRVGASADYAHAYYLQWRNTDASGCYDSGLGDLRFRFGPVSPGLLVWYYNSRYLDNSIADYLTRAPSYGPKGRMLVVEANPEPYLDPFWTSQGVLCEVAKVCDRSLMRDAAFSLSNSLPFELKPPYLRATASFAGRPAVPLFSDALGYYPGLEPAVFGAGVTNGWMTRHWDGSVVVPATHDYGVKAEGYTPGSSFNYMVQEVATAGTNRYLMLSTNTMETGVSLCGSGNPGASGAAYRWNVRVINQTPSKGLVRIWRGSPVAITSISCADPGKVCVGFEAVPNRTMALERAFEMGGMFEVITNGVGTTNFTVPMTGQKSFYRVGIR